MTENTRQNSKFGGFFTEGRKQTITIFLKNNLKINMGNKMTKIINITGRNKENSKDWNKEYSNK